MNGKTRAVEMRLIGHQIPTHAWFGCVGEEIGVAA